MSPLVSGVFTVASWVAWFGFGYLVARRSR